MTLHNYIRRHAECDRNFEKIKDNPNYLGNQPINNIEDDYSMASASNSQEIDNLRDVIVVSLMEA